MDRKNIFRKFSYCIRKYRVHFFVFFLALFIGLTLAHPSVILNDEFITTGQLRQLHAGHQIIVNEGKYGFYENGTMTQYFVRKSNLLGYSLFIPIVSLPAYWMIDLTGEHFVFLILILWTVAALMLTLFISLFFRKFSFIGRWQWIPLIVGAIFIIFFINLFFYSSFPVDPISNFPEIIAIVFTNIILMSFSAVMIYEINRTIFEDPAFSFFGSLVCLFSSSCFLWATFCKDHILVLLIFIAVFLCLVRFFKTDEYWYLPLAFLLCGTLAWARPEIALWTFLLVCGICGYTFIRYRSEKRPGYPLSAVLFSPLFTVIGALPFFLNNYLITKNIFLPVQSLYLSETTESFAINSSHSFLQATGVKLPLAVITMFIPAVPASPLETLVDLMGIFFYPQNGSISVFAIVPLAFVMIVLAGVLLLLKKIYFSGEEKKFMILSLVVSIAAFFTYASQIHLLNTDPGIAPDIRYLIPLYLPLTIISLIILRKTDIFPDEITVTIRQLFVMGIFGLALTVFMLPRLYSVYLFEVLGFVPLGKFFSIYALSLIILTLGVIFSSSLLKCGKTISTYLILLLCLVPFFWQVNTTFMLSTFSFYAMYVFWIPVVNIIWKYILIFTILFK